MSPPAADLTTLLPDTYVWIDAHDRIVDVRGEPTSALGVAPDAMLGVAVSALPIAAAIPVTRALSRLRTDGTLQHVEWAQRGEDGVHAWEGRLVRDGDRALLVIRDQTDRRRAEMAGAAQRERLVVTLRSIGDGVISTDREERVVLMNPAAESLLGRSMEAARGLEIGEVLGSEHLDPWGGVRQQVRLPLPGGGQRLVKVSMAPVLQQGQLLGAVYVLRDVTTEQMAETERLRASKLESVGLLAGGIAHDFNNLLAAIQGNLSVVRQIVSDVEVVEMLDDIDAATRRATALTRQLLTFSAGGAPVTTVGPIQGLIREAVGFGMRGSNVRQDYAIKSDLYPLDIDADQIAQVLQNLVINACQAMPEGGVLAVEAENSERLPAVLGGAAGPWVRVSIRDEGCGIPERELGRIFDPYFTTKPTGTGLGLASAYAIIRKHQGYMTVVSEVGKGSTFTMYLPGCPGADLPQTLADDRVRLAFSGRVLVVDDEQALRVLATRVLGSLGLDVVACRDGEEGVRAYREAMHAGQRFDAVMLDLTIPGGMGGREAVLRILDLDPDAVCIATSGYSTDPVLARFHEYGFRARLAKPYDRRAAAAMFSRLWPTPLPALGR